jgi:hypothetical protein
LPITLMWQCGSGVPVAIINHIATGTPLPQNEVPRQQGHDESDMPALLMTPAWKFTSLLVCFLVFMFPSCLVGQTRGEESPITVSVQDSKIQIKARDVPLDQILKALAKKTGLLLQLGDPLEEKVSCDFSDASLETVLKRLLTNRSYSLAYKEPAKDQPPQRELRILGKGSGKAFAMPPTVETVAASPRVETSEATTPKMPSEHSNNLDQVWFSRYFGAEADPAGQIAADPVPGSEDISPNGGLHIRELPEDSVFAQLGLGAGETITNVNGRQIRSVQDLVQALQSVPQDHPIIRIERWRSDKMFDPIYLELQ